ncbi:hypothetical protein B0T09DRAFT_344572 [Sordaria sp. MPI-SDFR-AT-0083]|nr:hypothetical protein B0T09DRAFT_344572 [Sordaria sp. MPI-SDFR-AT-0083]
MRSAACPRAYLVFWSLWTSTRTVYQETPTYQDCSSTLHPIIARSFLDLDLISIVRHFLQWKGGIDPLHSTGR